MLVSTLESGKVKDCRMVLCVVNCRELSKLIICLFLSIGYSLACKYGPTTFWTTPLKAQVMYFDYVRLHTVSLVLFMNVTSFVMGTCSGLR